MKDLHTTSIWQRRSAYLLIVFLLIAGMELSAQVAISTDNAPAHSSSMMEIKSGNLGVLTPRMTQSDRQNISNPATGLIVYQTDFSSGFYYYNGSSWDRLSETLVETDPVYTAWNKQTGISITASQVSDFNTAVTNTPAVLANTAKNTYPAADAAKLAGIEAGAEVNVQRDWNAVSGDAMILNKPSFSPGIPLPSNPATNSLFYYENGNWVAKSMVIQPVGSSVPVSNIQPYLALNYTIAYEGIYPSRNDWYAFIGEIVLYPYNFAPLGTMFCHGQILSIYDNSALFSLIGTYYGGNGQTTFALPDLRGRTAIHFGTGPGLPTINMAQIGGTETFTLNASTLPSHSHSIIYQ